MDLKDNGDAFIVQLPNITNDQFLYTAKAELTQFLTRDS